MEAVKYQDGRVSINAGQYFDNVPETAWNAFVGGYQPAQKWLKDRKGRTLAADDVLHYKAIILALIETTKLTARLEASRMIPPTFGLGDRQGAGIPR